MLILLHTVDNEVNFIVHFVVVFWTCKYSAMHLVSVAYLPCCLVIMCLSCDCQVTMEWWTHLWLNEGFATWIEYLCVDHTHPEFDIWTNFLSREYANALSLDSLTNSHPIEVRGQQSDIYMLTKLPGCPLTPNSDSVVDDFFDLKPCMQVFVIIWNPYYN